jgi:hypothetical protein
MLGERFLSGGYAFAARPLGDDFDGPWVPMATTVS